MAKAAPSTTKNLRFDYNVLFREFQSFGAFDVSDGWALATDSNPLNYATSEYGNKIFVFDAKTKILYFLMARDNDEGAQVIENIKSLVTNNIYTALTAISIATAIGNEIVYSDSIDMAADVIYKQATALNPYLDEDSSNMGAWVSGLIDGAINLTARGLLNNDYGSVGMFSSTQYIYGYAEASPDITAGNANLSDVILVIPQPDADSRTNIIVDGVSGPTDVLVFSNNIKSIMKPLTGAVININDAAFTLSTSGGSQVIAANSFRLTTLSPTKVEQQYSGSVVNIDFVSGTDGPDVIIGRSSYTNADTFEPGLGADIVIGNGGTFKGSLVGKDRVQYWGDGSGTTGITVTTRVQDNRPCMDVTDTGRAIDKLYNINYVCGTMGTDTFTNGNTTAFEAEFVGVGGADTFKGSLTGSFTRVSYAFDPSGVSVNLSSTSVVDQSSRTVLSGKAIDGFSGLDTLSVIKGLRGSDFDDCFYGGNANEVFTPGLGDDYIRSGRGDDNIWGSNGDDIIVGGAGVDIMFGDGPLGDTSYTRGSDTFVFTTLTDSAGTNKLKGYDEASAPHRVGDLVMDFDIELDILDLSAIDASTKKRNDQPFTASSSTTEFDRTPGRLIFTDGTVTLKTTIGDNQFHSYAGDFRQYSDATGETTYEQTGVFIEGDVNGDRQPDFCIFLVGLSAGDFTDEAIDTCIIL